MNDASARAGDRHSVAARGGRTAGVHGHDGRTRRGHGNGAEADACACRQAACAQRYCPVETVETADVDRVIGIATGIHRS